MGNTRHVSGCSFSKRLVASLMQASSRATPASMPPSRRGISGRDRRSSCPSPRSARGRFGTPMRERASRAPTRRRLSPVSASPMTLRIAACVSFSYQLARAADVIARIPTPFGPLPLRMALRQMVCLRPKCSCSSKIWRMLGHGNRRISRHSCLILSSSCDMHSCEFMWQLLPT